MAIDELAAIADSSAFIFTGNVVRTAAPAAHADHEAVDVSVEDVIKVPIGMRGLTGREVTVHPRHPLAQGRYVRAGHHEQRPSDAGEDIGRDGLHDLG